MKNGLELTMDKRQIKFEYLVAIKPYVTTIVELMIPIEALLTAEVNNPVLCDELKACFEKARDLGRKAVLEYSSIKKEVS